MSAKNLPRAQAREQGLTTYHSDRLCLKCKSLVRYVSSNACIVCSADRVKQSYLKNPQRHHQNVRKWNLNNPDKVSAMSRRWKEENPEKYRQVLRNWRSKNLGAAAYYKSLRRARILQATPKWADLDKIRAIYKQAAELGMTVDHIYPLKGKNVCGLHVENNLQIISSEDNSSKGNRPLSDR